MLKERTFACERQKDDVVPLPTSPERQKDIVTSPHRHKTERCSHCSMIAMLKEQKGYMLLLVKHKEAELHGMKSKTNISV